MTQKNRKTLIIYNSIGAIFFGLQFLFLGAYSGAIINVIAIIKNFVYLLKGKNKLFSSWFSPILFTFITIIIAFFTFDGIISMLPIVANIINVYATWFNNTKVIKLSLLLMSVIWIIYDIFCLAWVGLGVDIILLTTNILSLIFVEKKKNTKSDEELIINNENLIEEKE